ncbi:MAG: DUF2953 domain-containing protein [Alkalispirochaetaceae bacterium]
MSFLGVLGAVATVVGWTLLGVLLLAIAALAVPFEALYDSARSHYPFRVTWLWGAVRLFPRSRKGEKGGPKGAGSKKDSKKASHRGKAPNPARRRAMIRLFRDPEFRRTLLRDILRLLRRVEIPLIDLRLVLGLADPADTGLAYGFLSAAAAAVRTYSKSSFAADDRRRLRVEPIFDHERVDLFGRASLRLVPIAVLGTAVAVGFGPTGRRTFGTLWRTRR